MYFRYSLKVQFLWGAITISIIATAMSAVVLFGLKTLADLNTRLYEHPFTVSNTVRDIDKSIISMHRYMKDIALAKNTQQMQLAIQHVNKEEKAILKKFDLLYDRFLGSTELVDKAKKSILDWTVIRTEMVGLMLAGKFEKAALITKKKGALHVLFIEKQMNALLGYANFKADEFVTESHKIENLLITTAIALLVLFFLLAFAVMFGMYKRLMTNLSLLSSSAHRISKGDYLTSMPDLGDNELGYLSQQFERMRLSILLAITKTKESRKQLQLAMEAANIGLWDWYPKTDKLQTNDIFLTMFGHSPQDFTEITKRWTSLIHPDDLDTAITKIQPYLDGDDSLYYFEYRMRTAEGDWKWILDTGRVIKRDDQGNAEHFTGIIIDIAEQKKHEVQLVVARRAADNANKAKSVFLANMSHELRTPMHGILSFVNMGLNKPERLTPKKTLEYFGHIKTSAERLLTLIDDLLDMAKLEAGKMDFNFQKYSLKSVAQGCIAEQHASLTEQDKTISFHPDCESGKAMFDAVRIGQVVTNFLSNAIKFTPTEESIYLSISESRIQNVNGEEIAALLFVTRDHGEGIPEGECEQIFEKFIQSSATKTSGGGTGLGLPICKEIIDAHSGLVWAENHPDGGAEFKFLIPIEQNK